MGLRKSLPSSAEVVGAVLEVLLDETIINCVNLQVGVQFIGNTVYTSVWVAAVCLFMELLGFSTQKWITAGGFGTVLITLAGREVIFFELSHCDLQGSMF